MNVDPMFIIRVLADNFGNNDDEDDDKEIGSERKLFTNVILIPTIRNRTVHSGPRTVVRRI